VQILAQESTKMSRKIDLKMRVRTTSKMTFGTPIKGVHSLCPNRLANERVKTDRRERLNPSIRANLEGRNWIKRGRNRP
jgi:hypothetical protein